MTQDNTTQVTQADVDYVAGLCADRKGAWQSKVMRALIAIGRRTEAASRAREDALAAKVERLRGALGWYADQMCEGLCLGKDPQACANIGAENCAGCPAVVALHKAGERA